MAFQMYNPPPVHPLHKEIVLVQSHEMAQWLKQELAACFGISAALEFTQPQPLIWKLFSKVLDDIPEQSAFSREIMSWHLMQLIPQMLDMPEFAPLKNYLADDEDGMRCFQLTRHVAETFERYIQYRPQWIMAWEAGDPLSEVTERQSWQPLLWQALVKKLEKSDQPARHHANIFQSFVKRLKQGPPFKRPLPERIFIIGASALPAVYLKALAALSGYIEIHLFNLNPCKYWRDICNAPDPAKPDQKNIQNASGHIKTHALLASFGRPGLDYNAELIKIESSHVKNNDTGFVKINEDSLLHAIQKDILESHERRQTTITAVVMDDLSLAIHGCYTILREVEVLHDQLLARLNDSPTLKPRDIMVMTPEVGDYVSAFHAVFGTKKNSANFIPYTISDKKISTEYPVLNCLHHLLALNIQRCTATELLSVLETPAVQRRFSIDEKEFNIIKRWIKDAGVRWGLNQKHQQQFDVPERYENTWLFGLERMLLGYAMPESDGLFAGRLSLNDIQGNNAVLAGHLADFLSCINELVAKLPVSRTADGWCQFIHSLINTFFETDSSESDHKAETIIFEILQDFADQLAQTGNSDEKISLPIVRDYLSNSLGSHRSSQHFLSGNMTVGTLMPMRPIPFRLICLLGMSDDAYPRSIPPVGFDLLVSHPERGDYSRADEDRYLFLEAIISAQDALYISYIARDIQDDSEKPASILVNELLDYCKQSFCCLGDEKLQPELQQRNLEHFLTTSHPLMPFSRAYFETCQTDKPGVRMHKKLFSYAKEWLPAAKSQLTEKRPCFAGTLKPADPVEQVTLENLIYFYNSPVRYFCQQKLKIFFDRSEDAMEDNEPFALDPLEKFMLKQELLQTCIEGKDLANFYSTKRAEGVLPHGHFGQREIDKIRSTLESGMLPALSEIMDDSAKDVEINLVIDKISVTGHLKGCYEKGLLHYRPSRTSSKFNITAWLQHLCYCATASDSKESLIIQEDATHKLSPLSKESAREHLRMWLQYFVMGQQYPLPFFPKTASQWLVSACKIPGLVSEEPEQQLRAKNKALLAFNGGFAVTGEVNEDSYVRRVYPMLEESIFNEMTEIAKTLLLPLDDAITKVEKEKK